MPKTTKIILIVGAVVVVGYLLLSKSSPLKVTSSTKKTGVASYLDSSAGLANGLSNLWDSVFGSSTAKATADASSSSTTDIYAE